MNDHTDYFEKWLSENCIYLELTDEHHQSARAFFETHHKEVGDWCQNRNHLSSNVKTPSMLPYSSFLWQWCAHEAQAAPPETRQTFEKILQDIKLPIHSRVQSELSECWFAVLRYRYLPFPFE